MDKFSLYEKAKEAYYNGSEALMPDLEFDELEKELGLENKSKVGFSSLSYTVKHPVGMGSLSKIQIKKNKGSDQGHSIDFRPYREELQLYLSKTSASYVEVSPKYDGCSIELVFNHNGELLSASTRGDGEYGQDVMPLFMPIYSKLKDDFHSCVKSALKGRESDLAIRGECLVKLDTFNKKHSGSFANPRAFVAGLIGQKWEGTERQQALIADLDFVFYTFIEIGKGKPREVLGLKEATEAFSAVAGKSCNFKIADFYEAKKEALYRDDSALERIYYKMEEVREASIYALDGFVLKPDVEFRLNDFSRQRPEDCVAIKFVPNILESKIISINWKLGKTGEWFPTAEIEPVHLDGKTISKASLHNYNYIVMHSCSIGSKVKVSLAGDIIPFIYEVCSAGNGDIQMPTNSIIEKDEKSEVLHLMVSKQTEDEKRLARFIASAKSLNLAFIGEKTAEKVWKAFTENRERPTMTKPMFNVCQLFDDYSKRKLVSLFGESKSTLNIIGTLEKAVRELELWQVIDSLNFPGCGPKVSKRIAEMIWSRRNKGHNPAAVDFSGLNSEAWAWFFNKNSEEWKDLMNLAVYFSGKGTDLYDRFSNSSASQHKLKVILTGKPIGGMTKKQWLSKNSDYEETTKWDECEFLVTDSLESSSSKMTKAKKLGIPIKLYW